MPLASLAESPADHKNIGYHSKFLSALSTIANWKSITLAQASVTWVGALGNRIIPLPGSS